MSNPPPPADPGDPSGLDPDLAAIEAALDPSAPSRLGAAVRIMTVAVQILCGLVIMTGLAVLALGLNAWNDTPAAVILVVVVAALSIGPAAYVSRRATALATAVANPGEVVSQARDLVARATGSPELHALANLVRRRKTRSPGPQLGRVRRTIARGRVVSAVIGIASPDPKRHSHLMPFTPERLRNLWLAIAVTFWGWVVASVVAVAAFAVLVSGAI